MKTLKFIYIFLIIAGFYSCNDFVDITPRGNAIASTLGDVDLLLNNGSGLADGFSNNISFLINDNINMRPADIAAVASVQRSASLSRIYNLESLYYTADEEDGFWQSTYNKIGTMNYVLEVLNDIEALSDKDAELKKNYTGEALTRRAFYYFILVNIYGSHYGLPIAAEANSGVPIVTEFGNETVSIKRRSVNDVYDFIMSDLQKALPLLKNGRATHDRINKAAAHAILARVNLHMGKYNEALNHANMALSFNSTLINYGTLPSRFGLITIPNGLDNPEHVFFTQSTVPSTRAEGRTIVFGRFSPGLTALYDPFNDRRANGIPAYDASDASLIYGLFGFFAPRRHALGVTVPELLLIRAEVLARAGNIAGAMTDLNLLRANRFTTSSVTANRHLIAAANQTEAIAHVINERRREFHVNGMRFFDIKRLNAIENAGISLTRGNITFSPNGANWAVPLGFNVVNNSNQQIVQNPRE